MGAPTIFEKQIEIKLLHPASTLESRIQVYSFKYCIASMGSLSMGIKPTTRAFYVYPESVTP
jgi:hypothetical protein